MAQIRINENTLNHLALFLTTIVVSLAFIAWAQRLGWSFSPLSSYQIFPLLGLLAFSLMWTHYVVAAVRMRRGIGGDATKVYFESTSIAVLILILLHPAILIRQTWRDGLGLPPDSISAYIGSAGYWTVSIAMIALFAFLLYELRKFHSHKSWWKYVQYASDVAMVLIFIHALSLGGTLQIGWYRAFWYLLGVGYLVALVAIYGPSSKQVAREAKEN